MPKNKLKTKKQKLLTRYWDQHLSDYVTVVVWSPDSRQFAASSAAGEVVIYTVETRSSVKLQTSKEGSIDALAFSADGRFLAAGGQIGTLWIWQIEGDSATLLTTLEQPRSWIDCLQWHPSSPELAFSFGRYVQVWHAVDQTVVTTLDFENSSVLDLDWHPQGIKLSVAGNQSIKTWNSLNWDEHPYVRETGSASVAIAWSPDGKYLASGNNDRSVLVWEQDKENDAPWRMSGFPGKVRELAWSTKTVGSAPLLASISGEGIVVWTKAADSPEEGWNPQVLDAHDGMIRAVSFQPDSLLFSSAADDGRLYLYQWKKAYKIAQILTGADGFSCLAWSDEGKTLVAGGHDGKLLTWTKSTAGKGF